MTHHGNEFWAIINPTIKNWICFKENLNFRSHNVDRLTMQRGQIWIYFGNNCKQILLRKNFLITLNQATFNYNNNRITMTPSTPIRISNSNVAKVTASPAARKGILPSIGNDPISPMKGRRITRQYQARLKAKAYAMICTNPFTKRYLKATLPALRRHLLQVRNLQQRVAGRVLRNAISSAMRNFLTRRTRRKRSAASRASRLRNKKAEKAI